MFVVLSEGKLYYYILNYSTPLETQKHTWSSIYLCIHSNLCLQILELPLLKLFAKNILQKKLWIKPMLKKQQSVLDSTHCWGQAVVILPGLEAFTNSKYIKTFSDCSIHKGQIRSCFLNFEIWFHNNSPKKLNWHLLSGTLRGKRKCEEVFCYRLCLVLWLKTQILPLSLVKYYFQTTTLPKTSCWYIFV